MKLKGVLISIGIVIAIIFMFVGMFININNKAINLEEQINGAKASINVQEKRRVDLINNLVDTVKDYNKYEAETLKNTIAARESGNNSVENAQLAIKAVAEAYPELKSNENYKQFMTELALTENMIAENRNNYNIQIKSYNKFIRTFPTSVILNTMGYEKVDFTYTDYEAPEDAPQKLFDK